ncbi:hypothetical protein NEFER03_1794 [Nematocida sp. LUAm3]|nr:hypothetical protein NEFER03_1794 [Nematocida sp. LUAm3]KAI5173899.1 hypothetical protein NEFER02_0366 [Nematocida sp. LUAm2]KAI5177356.1 hypothetical protein NEFER01_0631 [Nematocida sp. LUAm1]
MNVNCKILSWGNEENKEEHGEWWWEGAPVFTEENKIKVLFNGVIVPFNEENGEFSLYLESIHEIKIGILEIFVYLKGILFQEVIGYTFKRVEEVLHKDKGTVYYFKMLTTPDPISAWIYNKQKNGKIKPKSMEYAIAVYVEKYVQDVPLERKPSYSIAIAKYLTGEQVAGRLMDLREVFRFLFRDIRDFSELAYGGREVLQYYAHVDKETFTKIPEFPYADSNGTFWEKIKSFFFRSKTPKIDQRPVFAKILMDALPAQGNSEYSWHVQNEEFYLFFLKNYRYALSSYGRAFLSVHSILNIISKKIKECKCSSCRNKSIGLEEKFLHTFTGIPYEDILHKESKYLAYVIFVEKETKTLYISFKGTLMTREALIDCDFKYYKYNGHLYHKGFFLEAMQFFKEKKSVLLRTMEKESLEKIKLVGQSLGGALATITTILIKESKEFSPYKVGCTAFSSPPIITSPCVFKKWDTNELDTSIITMIYGNDIFSTLCLGNIFELRLLITHLYTINVSRYKNKYKYIENTLKKLKKKGMTKLYIPGKIYQIRHTRTNPGAFLIRRTHWSYFSCTNITTKSFVHHTPSTMINALYKSLRFFYDNTEPETPSQ